MLLWSWIRDWGDIYMQHCIFTNKFIVAQSHFRAALTQPCKDDLKVLMSEVSGYNEIRTFVWFVPCDFISLCYWDIQYNGGRRFDHDAPAGRERMLRIIHMIMFWHLVLNTVYGTHQVTKYTQWVNYLRNTVTYAYLQDIILQMIIQRIWIDDWIDPADIQYVSQYFIYCIIRAQVGWSRRLKMKQCDWGTR